MDLSSLPKVKKRSKKRVGRGYGSGKGGHTVGRGTKGQKSRSGGKTKLAFEGGQLPFIKRLPHKRGFKRPRGETVPINLTKLKRFEKNTIVDKNALIKVGVIEVASKKKIKILGLGEINESLIIKGILCSSKAAEKIIKAGGEIIE